MRNTLDPVNSLLNRTLTPARVYHTSYIHTTLRHNINKYFSITEFVLVRYLNPVVQIHLLERQELQQRVKFYLNNRGRPEHWLYSGVFKRIELQKALGNHLSWKER